MELWEKKLRNAIRTEIRGLVSEGKLNLATIADNLELDVSDLLAEADVLEPATQAARRTQLPRLLWQRSAPPRCASGSSWKPMT